MRTGLFNIFVLGALFCLWSCEKENPIEKQEERIEAYIKARMNRKPSLKLSQNGSVYYLYEPGDTTIAVATGDSIYFYYAGTLVSDTSKYFDTNSRELANMKVNMPPEKFVPVKVIAGNNNLLPGLSGGLNMVHLNDFGEIIFNSDLGFGEAGNGVVPPFSPLIFKVKIIEIKKN
jgi:FKBP-type peptidyl-prolyl cis-trans isomerase